MIRLRAGKLPASGGEPTDVSVISAPRSTTCAASR